VCCLAARRVWPVSRACLLLRSTWSYLRICRGSVLPYTRFCNCLLITITFCTLLTSLFCIIRVVRDFQRKIGVILKCKYGHMYFFQSFTNAFGFIITQKPLVETEVDLWRMCMEHDANGIVVLSDEDDVLDSIC
jgi:hypothetical protein